MNYCPDCGAEISPEDNFCSNCGTDISTNQIEDTASKSTKKGDSPTESDDSNSFETAEWMVDSKETMTSHMEKESTPRTRKGSTRKTDTTKRGTQNRNRQPNVRAGKSKANLIAGAILIAAGAVLSITGIGIVIGIPLGLLGFGVMFPRFTSIVVVIAILAFLLLFLG